MKKLLVTIALLFGIILNAQNIDVKWSEQFEYDNKKDGFFDGFIGNNSTYIYGKFSNLALSPRKKNNKVKLIAFDKQSMKKMGDAELMGFDSNKSTDDMEFFKTVTLDNAIYAFYTKKAKGITELYVESYDAKLKRVNKIKKVYEFNQSSKGVANDKLVILHNNLLDKKILMLKEFGVSKDNENLRVEYKILNNDFTLAESRQVTLPVIITKKKRGLFSSAAVTGYITSYEYGDDGNVYLQDIIRLSDEERKTLTKAETSVYPHLMQITPQSGTVKEYHLKFAKKNTFNFSTMVTTKGAKLYGFFSDLEKDEKGRDTHGTFYINLDNTTLKPTDTKFSYFDKQFLDVLFSADKENQKKGKGIFKSDKAKASDEESLDDNYIIEDVVNDGTDIVLFCSIMRNWSTTHCTSTGKGGQTCYTTYHCSKSNVTTFKLNSSGNILWAKNLDRYIVYDRWNVYDLNVVKNAGSYYVVYGSQYQTGAKKKNMRSRKSSQQTTDRLEYAIFQSSTGDFKKNEYQVNALNTKKADKKFVSPANIGVYDNKMYVDCSKYKIKPATFISLLCPPVFYVLLLNGNSRKGKGYLGTITPLK
jgi:hypothetical protein